MCVAASVNSPIAQFYVIGINGLLLFQFGIYTNVTISERVFFLVFIYFCFWDSNLFMLRIFCFIRLFIGVDCYLLLLAKAWESKHKNV